MPGQASVSPNGAYRFWVRNPDTSLAPPWGAALTVDAERTDRRTVLLIQDVAAPLEPRWVNEKLIFLRVAWGRSVFNDLILDVEDNRLVFNELVRDGSGAYEQFQQACSGPCPCPDEDPDPVPAAKPGPNALIGLLQLPQVFGPPEQGGVGAAEDPGTVTLHAGPDVTSERLGMLSAIDDFEFREYTCEGAAAVVYEEADGWYRIGLRTRRLGGRDSAWVNAGGAGDFLPIGALLVNRLAYLNSHWDGRLWPWPPDRPRSRGTPAPGGADRGSARAYPVNVLETRTLDRGLWLRVETLSGDPCDGGTPEVLDRGWVPAYSDSGQLVAGFHARGC
jgi:hypothetical protein